MGQLYKDSNIYHVEERKNNYDIIFNYIMHSYEIIMHYDAVMYCDIMVNCDARVHYDVILDFYLIMHYDIIVDCELIREKAIRQDLARRKRKILFLHCGSWLL